MDEVFGETFSEMKSFGSENALKSNTANTFGDVHDTIFFYERRKFYHMESSVCELFCRTIHSQLQGTLMTRLADDIQQPDSVRWPAKGNRLDKRRHRQALEIGVTKEGNAGFEKKGQDRFTTEKGMPRLQALS